MKYLFLLALAAFAALSTLPQPAAAQDQGAGKAAPPVDAEVTVSAIRKLAELRKEIVLAEDRFLAKYNELNKDREYAITCTSEPFTGSRFYRRVCRPEFVGMATSVEAQTWLQGHYAPPSVMVMESKKDGFRKNMTNLYDKSAELRQLAQTRGELEKRYDDLLKRTVTGKGGSE